MSKAKELKLDIEELNSLMQQAQRQRSKDVLSIEVRKLQTELSKMPLVQSEHRPESSSSNSTKCYEVKLENYGWDQSDKYVKLYISLNNVQTLPEGAIHCDFTERSIDLKVTGLENRIYRLPICNLCEEIDTAKSYIKVKTDMIVVFLAKKVAYKQWSHVTGVEKRIKESKFAPSADMDKYQDAEGNLMNLMKKIYQDGDDEMKRVFAKAWTENQEKSKTAPSDFLNL